AVAMSALAIVATASSGTSFAPGSGSVATADALNGLVVRVTFSSTPTGAVGCGDSRATAPQGSSVQIERLALRPAGRSRRSRHRSSVDRQPRVSLAGGSIVGVGATFAVAVPGTGKVGWLGFSNVDKA